MTQIDTRPAAQRSEREKRAALRERIWRVQFKLIDGCEKMADDVTAQHTLTAASVATERRQVANILRMFQICPRAGCRRKHACMGEPLDCLRSGLTLVPPARFERLIAQRKRPRKR